MACMSSRQAAILICLAALAAPAFAQSAWYAGFSAGQSRTSRDLVANREGTVTLASDFSTTFDDKERAFKATLGYQAHRMVAVELSYVDLGAHELFSNFLGGDAPAPASIRLWREVTGIGGDVVFSAPLGQGATILGRVGAVRTRLKARQDLDGNVVFTGGDPSERSRTTARDETVGHYGIGLQWALDPRASLRIEWERYKAIGKPFEVGGTGTTGEADTDAVMAGVVFRF